MIVLLLKSLLSNSGARRPSDHFPIVQSDMQDDTRIGSTGRDTNHLSVHSRTQIRIHFDVGSTGLIGRNSSDSLFS